jgi:hypothetical protein
VGVQPPPAYDVSAGGRQHGLAGSGQEGPGKQNGGADFFCRFFGDLRAFYVSQPKAVGIGLKLFHGAAKGAVHIQHNLDIFYVGDVPQDHLFVGKNCSGDAGQGGIFIAAGLYLSTDGYAACNQILAHGLTIKILHDMCNTIDKQKKAGKFLKDTYSLQI